MKTSFKPSAAFSCWHIKYKIHLQSALKHVIFIVKIQKFSGEGAWPPSQTLPHREGDTPPAPTPIGACGASIFAPSALTHAPPPLGSLATGLYEHRFSVAVRLCYAITHCETV